MLRLAGRWVAEQRGWRWRWRGRWWGGESTFGGTALQAIGEESERSLTRDTADPMEVADMHCSELSWHAPRTSTSEDGDLNTVLQR